MADQALPMRMSVPAAVESPDLAPLGREAPAWLRRAVEALDGGDGMAVVENSRQVQLGQEV